MMVVDSASSLVMSLVRLTAASRVALMAERLAGRLGWMTDVQMVVSRAVPTVDLMVF